MKRTYTVNFDTFNKKGEVVGFTHQYTLFVKYADKFFDTLRGLMPDFNIYVVRSIPVTADNLVDDLGYSHEYFDPDYIPF